MPTELNLSQKLGRVSRIKHGNLLDLQYFFDSAGQITSQQEDTITIPYVYDTVGQLTDADYPGLDLSWTYDSAGNRATEVRNGNTTAYIVNAANELTQIGSATVKYDSAGNMVNRNNGTETFTWDEENRLTKYESGAVTVALQYASDWRIVSRTTGGTTEIFAYSGDVFAGKRSSAGTDTVSWLHSGEVIDQVLAEFTGAGTQYPITDMLGSGRGMTDPAGALAFRADYEAWGNLRGGVEPYLGFTGRPEMAGNMPWLRWRHLDPNAARFVSRDPIGVRGGVNLYAYIRNSDLLRTVDPFGLAGGGSSANIPIFPYAPYVPAGSGNPYNPINPYNHNVPDPPSYPPAPIFPVNLLPPQYIPTLAPPGSHPLPNPAYPWPAGNDPFPLPIPPLLPRPGINPGPIVPGAIPSMPLPPVTPMPQIPSPGSCG